MLKTIGLLLLAAHGFGSDDDDKIKPNFIWKEIPKTQRKKVYTLDDVKKGSNITTVSFGNEIHFGSDDSSKGSVKIMSFDYMCDDKETNPDDNGCCKTESRWKCPNNCSKAALQEKNGELFCYCENCDFYSEN
jgi:hypothetical protein